MQSQNSNMQTVQQYDSVIRDIADYVLDETIESEAAFDIARYCIMDTLGCGFLALKFPECTKHIGPIVPGTIVPGGARVPGTNFIQDPVKSAWDIGCIIRWLDFNDTWLAQEWGHPSDNLGAILACTDYVSQLNISKGEAPLKMRAVLEAMIKAHEIQGVIALQNSFNQVGLDHVLLVRVASTAVAAKILGANKEQMCAAISQAWVDGCSLRTYRHAPNAGSRKSWAAGDATSRAVHLALMSIKGEMGIPTVLSTPQWGYYDILFKGNSFVIEQPYSSYVMENILFKLSFPAEFHAQTACEAAIKLHLSVKNKLDAIDRIDIDTHISAIRIIVKDGDLHNPADRDHCLQYMVAVPLIFGDLKAEHYSDAFHNENPIIDTIREKMHITENERYSKEYLDSDKRSIANAIKITFKDGTSTERIEVEYPIGHKRRREEGKKVLLQKFNKSIHAHFETTQCDTIEALFENQKQFEELNVNDFVNHFTLKNNAF